MTALSRSRVEQGCVVERMEEDSWVNKYESKEEELGVGPERHREKFFNLFAPGGRGVVCAGVIDYAANQILEDSEEVWHYLRHHNRAPQGSHDAGVGVTGHKRLQNDTRIMSLLRENARNYAVWKVTIRWTWLTHRSLANSLKTEMTMVM